MPRTASHRGGVCYLMFKWVVPGELATSGMLSGDVLHVVSRTFKTVVVLAEAGELEYSPGELEEKGLAVIWEPVEDFSAPPLIRLHLIVRAVAGAEKPVLVHCSGGRGRSGTVAVAYLIATRGLSFEEALLLARSVEPGYVETREQERVLKLYSRVLRACGYQLFTRTIEVGAKYGFGWGLIHASSVLEHSTELVEGLERALGITLPVFWERALYVSAVLHDIGVWIDEEEHREHSHRLILEHARVLNEAAGGDVAKPAAVLARYHGGRDPVPRDLPRDGLIALSVLRIADGLDYTGSGTVGEARLERGSHGLVLLVKPLDPSLMGGLLAKIREKARLLEEVIGLPLNIAVA